MSNKVLSSLLLTVVCAISASPAQAELLISQQEIREAPPNMRVLAGFFTVKNNGARMEELRGASSTAFERAELHMTYLDNGMMRMKQVPVMKIAPGQSVQFKPGGFHLMLINPVKTIKAGDTVEITLQTAADQVSFVVPVVRQQGVAGR